MDRTSAWGAAQDAAYHLERAITKEVAVLLLVGGDMIPEARAALREAGDFVQMAHKDVEAFDPKTKKRTEAQAAALKALKAAEKKGVEGAMLLFQEKVGAKDVVTICDAVSAAIASELAALQALLSLRG